MAGYPADRNNSNNLFFPNKNYPNLQKGKGSKDIRGFMKYNNTVNKNIKPFKSGKNYEEMQIDLVAVDKLGNVKFNGLEYEEWLCRGATQQEIKVDNALADPMNKRILVKPNCWFRTNTYAAKVVKDVTPTKNVLIALDAMRSKKFKAWYDPLKRVIQVSIVGNKVNVVESVDGQTIPDSRKDYYFPKGNNVLGVLAGGNRQEISYNKEVQAEEFFVEAGALEGHQQGSQ